MDVGAAEGGLELHRGEPRLPRAQRPVHHRRGVGLVGRRVGLERGVGGQQLTRGLTPEAPAGPPRRLPAQIPDRHVERAQRMDAGAPTPAVIALPT